MPNNAFTSPRATRLLSSAALTLALCTVTTAAPASARELRAPVAHSAQSQLRAQARADRKPLREARKAARRAQRSARRAEREARQATRASRRAERAGAVDTSAEAPAQIQASPSEGGEAPQTEPGAQRPAAARGRCAISAEASSPQVTAGATVTISGRLSCPSTLDPGGQEVIVSQRGALATTSALSVAGTAITQADGSYEVRSAQLQGRSVFIARSTSAGREARVLVTVTGTVSLQGPAVSGASLPMGAGKAAAGGPAKQTFTGTVDPAEAGRQVGLNVRYAGGEWRTVAFARTDAEGHFTFSHRFRFAGEVSVMAGARPRGEVPTRSEVLTYSIVQAQNPAITIAIAAAPQGPLAAGAGLPSSEPVTIAGAAAGCPNRAVTLLSRSSSGRFDALATTQADAAGAYSFTVAPTQTTVYAVKCERSRSTLVRREVVSSLPAAPAS